MRSRRRTPPVLQADSEFSPFRETVLVYVTNRASRREIRAFGDLMVENIVELRLARVARDGGSLTDLSEAPTRNLLRAAAADLRHLEAFLLQIANDADIFVLSRSDRALCRFASHLARAVGAIHQAIERRLRRKER